MALLMTDLVKTLALRTGLSSNDCHAIIKVFTHEVARGLSESGTAYVEGLGKFYTSHNNDIKIHFIPSEALKKLIIPKPGDRIDEIILE